MTTARPSSPETGRSDLLDMDNAFWRFSLSFYSRPDVAPACLLLQNRRSVDVNVLLLAIFAAVQRNRMLTSADLQAADDVVKAWREDVVVPLRRIRTRLKSGPAPAPSAVTEALRTQIKLAELKAEQIQQAQLMAFLDRLPPPPAPMAIDAKALIERVIQNYWRTPANLPSDPEISQAIQVLTNAVSDKSNSD